MTTDATEETAKPARKTRAEKDAEAKVAILAKLKSMENTPMAAVYEHLKCRPATPMHIQWRAAYDAVRSRGFRGEAVRIMAGINNMDQLRACSPYPRPEVVRAFNILLGGIPAASIFPCLRNSYAVQLLVAKDYLTEDKRAEALISQ